MKSLLSLASLFAAMAMTGCAPSLVNNDLRLCLGEDGIYQRCDGVSLGGGGKQRLSDVSQSVRYDVPTLFKPAYNHKLLGEYVEQMAIKLVDTLDPGLSSARFAISHFVEHASPNYQESMLGRQLAELFYGELKEFNLAVVDIKPIVFNSDKPLKDLFDPRIGSDEPRTYDYILRGNVMDADRGVIVNVRIVGAQNKQVIAATSGLIPAFVLRPVASES